MATEKEMYELLGRAMTDADFRATLTKKPAEAAAGLGITLTEEQQAGIKASDLEVATGALDERLSKWLKFLM